MKRASDERLERVKTLTDRPTQTWYTQKHTYKFAELCYIARILELWNDDPATNYGNFFDTVKWQEPFASNIGERRNYRSTYNLVYYGLSTGGAYRTSSLTPVYYEIKERCDADFSKTTLYQDIIDRQLERMRIDVAGIHINPFMFILKVMLVTGDATGDFALSAEEINRILGTSASWKEYFEVAETVLRCRQDLVFRAEYLDAARDITADIRFAQILDNYSLFRHDGAVSRIPEENVAEVRRRVARFELGGEDVDAKGAADAAAPAHAATPLQRIYFGAPGVGKSRILRSVYGDEADTVRITFHPETDYAAFVGCYKPVTEGRDIVYRFQGQAFAEAYVEAWKRYATDAPRCDCYLVIEEINRGNCAQIFGDIFQLLDRDNRGFSEYGVRPDRDLTAYLADELSAVRESLDAIRPGLGTGDVMLLPPNLHILATMNTSDQSLFPIDSAFKRRWEWVYMPVDTAPVDDAGNPVARTIATAGFRYDWGEFLDRVNRRIFDTTESEDKQLGFWFVKPKDGDTIGAADFVSKVVFYLWNDIYKDFGGDASSVFWFAADGDPDSGEKTRHSFRDFTPKFGHVDNALLDAFMRNLGVARVPPDAPAVPVAPDSDPVEPADTAAADENSD